MALELDSLDAASLERAIHETAPDILFNMVGYGVDRGEVDADLMWRINRDLVRHAAVALSRTVPSKTWSGGRRFVHVGSALEYGLMEGLAPGVRRAGAPSPATACLRESGRARAGPATPEAARAPGPR